MQALPALRAGLELDPAGTNILETAGLAHVPVSPEWALRALGAPRTALRLEELGRRPWRSRPRALARWFFPSPAIITGSVIQLRADKGRVKLVGNRPGGSFGEFCRPVVKFSPEELSLYGPRWGGSC